MSVVGLAMLVFISAYLIGIMPGLYMDQKKNNSIERAYELHSRFLSERTYKNINPENIFNTVSVVLPKKEYGIYASSGLFNMNIALKKQRYMDKLDEIRSAIESAKNGDITKFENMSFDIDLSRISGVEISGEEKFKMPDNLSISRWSVKNMGGTSIVHGSVKDEGLEYISIMAFDENEREYVITFVPLVYSSINDILPMLLSMLPTILLALLIILFISSRIISKSIIDPVIALQQHSMMLKRQDPSAWTSLNMQGNDEIAELSGRLDELHEEVKQSYENMRAEKERKELFIRASSHELKTPLASAIMLLDSMTAKVGRYADHEKFLPELKNIMLAMNKMLEELMPLRKSESRMEEINMREMFNGILEENKYLLEENKMKCTLKGDLTIKTWADIAERVASLALGNAVSHGEKGTEIAINLYDWGFSIDNKGHVDEKIIKHAFEPFVSSAVSNGHGLGLYIAKSYSKILSWDIDLKNTEEGVRFTCRMKK